MAAKTKAAKSALVQLVADIQREVDEVQALQRGYRESGLLAKSKEAEEMVRALQAQLAQLGVRLPPTPAPARAPAAAAAPAGAAAATPSEREPCAANAPSTAGPAPPLSAVIATAAGPEGPLGLPAYALRWPAAAAASSGAAAAASRSVEVDVSLPGCSSAAQVSVDVLPGGRSLLIDASEAGWTALSLALPGAVQEEQQQQGEGEEEQDDTCGTDWPPPWTAKFSKRTATLSLRFQAMEREPPAPEPASCSNDGSGSGADGGAAWGFQLMHLACDLATAQHLVVDDFLPAATADALAAEVAGLRHSGVLKAGEVEGGLKKDVRGDLMAWLDVRGPHAGPALRAYAAALDDLVMALSEEMPALAHAQLLRDRAMATCYPGGGARYVRHFDNFNANNKSRVLTAILYLNAGWLPEHGGALRLFLKPHAASSSSGGDGGGAPCEVAKDIPPVRNRLLLFWSDTRCPHEVLPTAVDRYAISFWYHSGTTVTEEEGKRRAEEEGGLVS